MINLFDDLNFLEFILCKIEKEIEFQEALIIIERQYFFNKQLDYELCKELHTLKNWCDEVREYIINLKSETREKSKMYDFFSYYYR